MQEKSNARYLGKVIGMALTPAVPEPPKHEPEVEIEDGNAPEPDPGELPDQDWAGQPTEYDPS